MYMGNMADISKVSRRKHERLCGIINTVSVHEKLWQHLMSRCQILGLLWITTQQTKQV